MVLFLCKQLIQKRLYHITSIEKLELIAGKQDFISINFNTNKQVKLLFKISVRKENRK